MPAQSSDDPDGRRRVRGAIQTGAAGGSPHRVVAKITDGLWSERVAFDWFVTVPAEADPPIIDLGPDADISEGVAFTRSGSFAAAGDGPWTATVDYGDGTSVSALALNPDKTFSLDHVYQAPGAYVVTVVVVDGRGGEGRRTLSVKVAAAPVDPPPVDPPPVDPPPVDPPPVVNPPVDPPPVSGPPASGFGAGPDAFVAALYRLRLGRVPSLRDCATGRGSWPGDGGRWPWLWRSGSRASTARRFASGSRPA